MLFLATNPYFIRIPTDCRQHAKSTFRKDYIKYHKGAEPDEAAVRKFYKGVVHQLDAFGADHVGFGAKHFPAQNISVVGARPCTWVR